MLKPVCDICKREVRGDIRSMEHYCERCFPFADEYRQKKRDVAVEALTYTERRLEQFRNEFLRDKVVPQTKARLEAVR